MGTPAAGSNTPPQGAGRFRSVMLVVFLTILIDWIGFSVLIPVLPLYAERLGAAPHQVLLTLDATTGHNGLAQAQAFTEAVGCTGIFLAKLDGTARGGIVLSIRRELGVPILFIGTGEGMADIAPFDAAEFVDAMLAPVD